MLRRAASLGSATSRGSRSCLLRGAATEPAVTPLKHKLKVKKVAATVRRHHALSASRRVFATTVARSSPVTKPGTSRRAGPTMLRNVPALRAIRVLPSQRFGLLRPDLKRRAGSRSSLLQTASVSPATEAEYAKITRQVLEFSEGYGDEVWENPLELDNMLVDLFDDSYLEGVNSSFASKVFAALGYYNPTLKKDAGIVLPAARQAAKGWKRLSPPTSRMPVPWELVCALANALMADGCRDAALLMLLSFVCYLRPSEAAKLQVRDLIPPVKGSQHVSWSLLLHPFERGACSKTQEFDESLLIDAQMVTSLGSAIKRHVAHKSSTEKLFSTKQKEMPRLLNWAARRLRVPERMKLCMYMMRHGGASHDFGSKQRTLQEVKRRGRWIAEASVRRYEKGGRLASQLHGLGTSLRAHALNCARSMDAVVAGRRSPRSGPY